MQFRKIHRPPPLALFVARVLLLVPAAICGTTAFSHGSFARADNFTWNATSGDWSTSANWLPSTGPAGGDNAYVDNGGTASVSQAGESCYYLVLGNGANDSGSIDMTAGNASRSLQATNEYVGNSGTGSFSQSGGTNTVTGLFFVGNNLNAQGTYSLSGSATLDLSNVTYAYVGYSGSGAIVQNGGQFLNYDSLWFGSKGANSAGSYTLSDGTLSAYNEHVGEAGAGAFNQYGGVHKYVSLVLGFGAAANGSYTLTNGTLTGYGYPNTLTVGYSGTGAFVQSGGQNSLPGSLYLGAVSGSNGTYNLSGTGQLSAMNEYVGYSGTGAFTQAGGVNSISGSLCLGSTNSPGTYNLDGGALGLGSIVNSGSITAAFYFGGGTLQARGNFSTDLDMTLTGSGGNSTIDNGSHDVTLRGQLFGSGGLMATGKGQLTLSGTNSFSGGLCVSGGTVVIVNPYSLRDGSKLVVGGDAAALFDSTVNAPLRESDRFTPVAVPEPGTAVLLLIGVATAVLCRRRALRV